MVQALFYDTKLRKLRVAALQIGFVISPGPFWFLLGNDMFLAAWPFFAFCVFVLMSAHFGAKDETKGELGRKLVMSVAAHFLVGVGITLLILTATISDPFLGAFVVACFGLAVMVSAYHVDLS